MFSQNRTLTTLAALVTLGATIAVLFPISKSFIGGAVLLGIFLLLIPAARNNPPAVFLFFIFFTIPVTALQFPLPHPAGTPPFIRLALAAAIWMGGLSIAASAIIFISSRMKRRQAQDDPSRQDHAAGSHSSPQ